MTPRIAGGIAAVLIFSVFFLRTNSLRRSGDTGTPPADSSTVEAASPPVFVPVPGNGLEAGYPELESEVLILRFSPVTGAPVSVRMKLPEGGEYELALSSPESDGTDAVFPWIRIGDDRIPLEGSASYERTDGAGIVFRNAYFSAEDGSFLLERSYRLIPGEYLVDVEITLRPLEGAESGGFPALAEFGIPLSSGEGRSFTAYSRGKKIHPSYDGDVIRAPVRSGWAGLEERYFALIAIPSDSVPEGADFRISYMRGDGLSGGLSADEVTGVLPKNSRVSYAFFLGPKSDNLLSGYQREGSVLEGRGEGLRTLVYPQGFLKPFMTLFSVLIRQIYSRLLGDFGLSVILIALLAKLSLLAFSRKGLESSIHMRRIQPELKSLRENPGLDSVVRKEKISALYKSEGVRPLIGIINLLIHLIIFIVISRIFTDLYDFRNAGSPALGLESLSGPDSLYNFGGRGCLCWAGVIFACCPCWSWSSHSSSRVFFNRHTPGIVPR